MVSVSVVVPAYNVERYICECLDNVCNQTFDDLEIICVDDGSTDSTLEIMNEYAKRDERIRVIAQENKGASGARNTGLRAATGKYLYFMDSDDYLEVDALEKLFNLSEEKSLDFIIFKLINVDDETGEKYPTDYYDMKFLKDAVGDNVFCHEDVPDHVFKIAVSPQGKFFNLKFLDGMEFVEGVIFEDNVFFVDALFRAKRILFVNEYLCNRRIRQNSLMTSNRNFTDFIKVSNMLVDVTKRHGLYDAYRAPLYEKILLNSFLRFTQLEGDSKLEYYNELKRDFLSKKEQYDSDEVFQNCDEKLKEIYYRCIESQTAKEYELYMALFNADVKLNEVIEKKNQIVREKNNLLKRSRDLSSKVNQLAHENRRLKSR